MDKVEYSIERVVSKMYQIYGLVVMTVLVWGIAIWASIPEEQEG